MKIKTRWKKRKVQANHHLMKMTSPYWIPLTPWSEEDIGSRRLPSSRKKNRRNRRKKSKREKRREKISLTIRNKLR